MRQAAYDQGEGLVQVRAIAHSLVGTDLSVDSAWLPGFGVGAGDPFVRRVPSLADDRDSTARQQIRVLLIEDDSAIAEMYRVQLEYDGFRVTVAATGENSFDALATAQPDIVLLDLLLPDRSGLEIMADLKARFPNHPPVVILSNYGEPAMIDRGMSLGALEYLVKSRVTPATVSQAIPGWIEQARRGRHHPRN
jgi:CheY-like chemotaxis protein